MPSAACLIDGSAHFLAGTAFRSGPLLRPVPRASLINVDLFNPPSSAELDKPLDSLRVAYYWRAFARKSAIRRARSRGAMPPHLISRVPLLSFRSAELAIPPMRTGQRTQIARNKRPYRRDRHYPIRPFRCVVWLRTFAKGDI